jgi:hypothetical protein
MSNIIDSVVTWFKRPFDSANNAVEWWLFVGLIIIAAWMWSVILRDVVER